MDTSREPQVGRAGPGQPADTLRFDSVAAQPDPETEINPGSPLAKFGIFAPNLDPSRPEFDFEEWSRVIVNLRGQFGVPSPPRSGFLFKELTVRGSEATFKVQETIWTALTSPFRIRRICKEKEAKTIIQGFNGVLAKGELLLVLGRPGSGCTTFLKTIAGEMHNIELAAQSVIQYSGMTGSLHK
jgi:hypothetical protein